MQEEVLLAGKWEMSIGKLVIPPELLGDINVKYSEGTIEANTQAGVRKQPSGKAEEAEITFTLFLPSLDYVKKAFSVAEADPMVFGGGNCKTRKPVPVNIHQICAGKDGKDDFHIYAGLVTTAFNPTLATSDAAQIELTLQMQPTSKGYMLLGYPDPSTPQYWDVDEQAHKAKPED